MVETVAIPMVCLATISRLEVKQHAVQQHRSADTISVTHLPLDVAEARIAPPRSILDDGEVLGVQQGKPAVAASQRHKGPGPHEMGLKRPTTPSAT